MSLLPYLLYIVCSIAHLQGLAKVVLELATMKRYSIIPFMTDVNIFGNGLPPKYEDYEKAVAQTIELERISTHDGMVGAWNRAAERDMSYKKFMGFAARIAMLVEPIDETTHGFVDDEQRTAESVRLGAAFGGLIAPRAYDSVVTLDTLKINLPKKIWESDGQIEARHMLAEYLFRYGDYGLTIMGSQATEMVEETESLVIEDVKTQRMFRIGCGIVVHALLEMHIRHNQKDMRRLVEQLDKFDDADWDFEFQNLLKAKDN